jgi:hypothetical protein
MPDAAFVRKPFSPFDVLERVRAMTEPALAADPPAKPEPPAALMAS